MLNISPLYHDNHLLTMVLLPLVSNKTQDDPTSTQHENSRVDREMSSPGTEGC